LICIPEPPARKAYAPEGGQSRSNNALAGLSLEVCPVPPLAEVSHTSLWERADERNL
jgi:hypothetical protein